MGTSFVVVIYLIFAVMISITIMIARYQKNLGDCGQTFPLLCSIVLCWIAAEITFLVSRDEKLFGMLFNLKIPFVALSAVLNLIVTIKFYRLGHVITPVLLSVLFVIPIITSVVALTNDYHHLFRSEFYVTALDPIKTYVNKRGIWFWVHTVQCYCMMLGSVGIMLFQHKKLPKSFRLSSMFYILGITTSMISNIVTLVFSLPFDITVVGMSLAFIFIYVAIAGSNNMDILTVARNDVFNYLEEYVFILDNNRILIDHNISAAHWLRRVGFGEVAEKDVYFENIITHLTFMNSEIKKSSNSEGTIEICLYHENRYSYFDMKERVILNEFGEEIGYYVSFFDMTHYKTLINHLEISAGMDPLTGLYNRSVYEAKKKELDSPYFYPLSVIMGDVNGLKKVNDEMGHKMGDLLIQTVGRCLQECCPKNFIVCRIGGDEFVILAPLTSEAEAKATIQRIQFSIRQRATQGLAPSISLGCATKFDINQNLENLIIEADEKMYRQKSLTGTAR